VVDNIERHGCRMLKEASYKRVRVDFRVNNGHCRNYSSLIPPLGYGAGRSGDPNPVGERFSAPVQTGPGDHPTTNTIGIGSLSQGKAAGVWRCPPTPI